jgi:hypothetical protein
MTEFLRLYLPKKDVDVKAESFRIELFRVRVSEDPVRKGKDKFIRRNGTGKCTKYLEEIQRYPSDGEQQIHISTWSCKTGKRKQSSIHRKVIDRTSPVIGNTVD